MPQPPISDDAIEQAIQDKDLTAPRVTLEQIENAIYSEHYFTAEAAVNAPFSTRNVWNAGVDMYSDTLERLTFCILVLKNDFTVVGKSAPVSPDNFDAQLGRDIARRDAIDQCWALFGFHLASTLRPL